MERILGGTIYRSFAVGCPRVRFRFVFNAFTFRFWHSQRVCYMSTTRPLFQRAPCFRAGRYNWTWRSYIHLQGGGWHANFISLSKWSLDARPFVLGQIPLNKTIFNVSHCIITYAKDACVFALRGVLNAQL